jgi:hypothetical protein
LKKSVPFDIEAAAISYHARRRGNEWEAVAVVTPQAVVRQYEDLATGLGLLPRQVTLSTLATLGLVNDPAGANAPSGERSSGGLLIAKYSPPWLTTAIVYGGSLHLFRTAALDEGSVEPLPPSRVLEALYPSVAYFQDTAGTSLEAALLCGMGATTGPIAEALKREFNLSAKTLLQESDSHTGNASVPDAERNMAALLGIAREQQRI